MNHHQSLDESIEFFRANGIGATLQHTQPPQQEGERYCATIKIGEYIDCPIRYAQLVQAIIKINPHIHAINKESINHTPPTACFGKLIIVDGADLNSTPIFESSKDLHMTTRIKQHNKNNKNSHITIETDELFAHSVINQWSKLFPSKRHGDGFLFHRNGSDHDANLFALSDMKCVLDDERHNYFSLMYSANDFADASQDIKLNTHKNLHDCLSWESSTTSCAALIEPTGSGKSKTFIKLAKLRTNGTHRIFTQPTRESRSVFVESVGSENIIQIFGNEELALVAIDPKHENEVKLAFSKYYEDEKAPSLSFKKFIDKELSFISDSERDELIEAHSENNTNMKRRDLPLCMTHDKLELTVSKCGEKYNPFKGSVIYSDEYRTGTVASLPNQKHKPSIIRGLKRLYASAESIALMEIKAWIEDVRVIGCGVLKQYDGGLYVMRVSSTRAEDMRDEWFSLVNPKFKAVIANGCGSDVNFTNNKGSNEWRNDDVCTIASYPTHRRVYEAMLCLRNDNFEYVRELLVVADITQSLGRNMGFRNESGANKHLLIIPHQLHIDMEFVTKHVYMTDDLDFVTSKMYDSTSDVSLHAYLSRLVAGESVPTKLVISELGLDMDEKSVNKKAKLMGLSVTRKQVDGVKLQFITRGK
tara:strand:+ start:4815 stop:6752 length:1938 start_codon:yes stop_codon:yes gene_type:complete